MSGGPSPGRPAAATRTRSPGSAAPSGGDEPTAKAGLGVSQNQRFSLERLRKEALI